MKNIFEIPIYEFVNNKFEIKEMVKYEITYLHGKRMKLRIVVNGYLTKIVINLNNYNIGYKNSILTAIKEYNERDLSKKYNMVVNTISMNSILNCYSKHIVKNIETYLLPINKEVSRDKLTDFGLINF